MKNASVIWCLIGLFGLLSISLGQQQVTSQVNQRAEPIYSKSPYSFRSTYGGYSPFQFNSYSGRWDYVPIPYSTGSQGAPYRFNWQNGQWEYTNWQPGVPGPVQGEVGQATPAQGPAASAVSPTRVINQIDPVQADDSQLWNPPPPAQESAPILGQFEGQIVRIKAIDLAGEPLPHLLVRLQNKLNVMATVDVGQKLDFSALHLDSATGSLVAAIGKMGDIDGSPVLFAERLTVGTQTVNVDRGPTTRPK